MGHGEASQVVLIDFDHLRGIKVPLQDLCMGMSRANSLLKGSSGIRMKNTISGVGNKPEGRRPIRRSLMSSRIGKTRASVSAVPVRMERNGQVQEWEKEWEVLSTGRKWVGRKETQMASSL